MIIIGVDYHPSDQYIAFVDTETGECGERQLNHRKGKAEKSYRELATRGVSVRVGMEATGYSRWFERLLAELGIELWIGDAAEIKTKRVRKQKTDREGSEVGRRCPLKPRPALGSCSALSGRRERTDRNVISVRISERELLGLSVRIHVWLLFEPSDERTCPLKRQVEIIDTEAQQEPVAGCPVIGAHQ